MIDWRLLAKIQSRAFVKFGVFRKEKKTSFGFDKLRPKFRGNYWRLTCTSSMRIVYIIHYFIYSVAFCTVRFSVPDNVKVLFGCIFNFSCKIVLKRPSGRISLFFFFNRLKNKVTQWKSLTESCVWHKMPAKDWKAKYL